MTQKILPLSLPVESIALTRILVFVIFSFLSFAIPFSLSQPQWLIGTTVNTCLFLGAIFLPNRLYLPLIIFPSLGVISRGVIFGPFTPFLIYFLPFIWLANLILILVFKRSFPRFKYIFSVFLAATAKLLLLVIIANVYFKFNFAPGIFLQAMGINQLLTALSGGIISWIIFNLYGEFYARNQKINKSS